MKFVKNIAIVACASSFMFAGIGFHYANNYGDMDAATTTTTSWGVTYDLNDNTSVGWDEAMGMLMMFDVPFGVSLRLGWTAGVDGGGNGGGGDIGGDGYLPLHQRGHPSSGHGRPGATPGQSPPVRTPRCYCLSPGSGLLVGSLRVDHLHSGRGQRRYLHRR